MASKKGDPVGAPTLEGSIAPGAGNTITLYIRVQPDWPGDVKVAIGHAFETGEFSAIKFDSVTLELLGKTTFDKLPEEANYFKISSQDTDKTTASRVSFWTKGGSTESVEVAFFILEPGLQIETIKRGLLQWHTLE